MGIKPIEPHCYIANTGYKCHSFSKPRLGRRNIRQKNGILPAGAKRGSAPQKRMKSDIVTRLCPLFLIGIYAKRFRRFFLAVQDNNLTCFLVSGRKREGTIAGEQIINMQSVLVQPFAQFGHKHSNVLRLQQSQVGVQPNNRRIAALIASNPIDGIHKNMRHGKPAGAFRNTFCNRNLLCAQTFYVV